MAVNVVGAAKRSVSDCNDPLSPARAESKLRKFAGASAYEASPFTILAASAAALALLGAASSEMMDFADGDSGAPEARSAGYKSTAAHRTVQRVATFIG